MAKNKSLKMLSTASVAGMVAAAVVSSQAFAAVDAYSVKVDNDVFQYSKADLTDSFLAAKAGEAAPLYEDFLARFEKASGFYAFHDNKTEKYVSVADITEKYLEAKAAGTEFVVDTYTESKDAKVLEVPTVKKVVVKDGKVVIENEQVEVKVDSVSAITAKALKVKFNAPVDTTKATIVVKKGSVTSNISSTTWNADKTEATIELAGKLTAGEYNVTVTGLSEKALTGSVTVENETVTQVKLLSDKAVLNSTKTNVTVGYQVLNQYGEDITSNYAVNPTAAGATVNTSSSVTATRGVVTVPVVNANVKEGDTVVVTLVHVATGKSVSQTLTVSAASAVADIQITGVYNKDGKVLDETSNLTRDAFYLVVEGKDQYGTAVAATALDALLKNNTNSSIVGLGSSFETIKINNEDKTVLRLTGTPTAGSTNVMLISATTGKNASYTVNVAEAQRADTITFQVPSLVVAGETLFVPVTVLDKAGNQITDIDVLNDTVRGIKIGGSSSVLTKNTDGVIGYSIASGSVTEGYLSLVALSATNKSTVQNIKVEAAAKPTVVRGLATTESAVLLANKTLSKASLVVEDQYGRAMSSSTTPLTLAANSSATSGYRIVAKDNATTTVLGNGGTALEIYDGNTVTLVKGINGSEKVEFAIEEYKNGAWTAVAGSSQDIEFRVTDGTEYASYEVAEIGTTLDVVNDGNATTAAGGDYDKEVAVYGVLDDGKKVKLATSEYTVTTSSNLTYNSGSNKLTTNVAAGDYKDESTEVAGKVTVTINATGKQFVKDVTISKVAPKVVDFKIVANSATIDTNGDSVISKEEYNRATELTTVPATTTAFFTSTAVNTILDFVAIDSYGVISQVDTGAAAALPTFTFVGTPAVAHTVTFANQNANTLEVAQLEKNEVVTITASVSGVSKSFKIAGIVDSISNVATDKAAIALTADGSNAVALPASGSNGTTITWTLNGSTVSSTATLTATSDVLVATISKGSASDTRTFTIGGSAGAFTLN